MKRLLPLVIYLIIAKAVLSYADVIYVSGDVSGTWSVDTVLVDGEIRVPPGETLVIDPGVKVLFLEFYRFIVDNNATLIAAGTETDSILFDEYTPGVNWNSLHFINASSSCTLEYCHLTHGQTVEDYLDAYGGAIYCSQSSPTIQNCLIDACHAYYKGGGIACMDYSSPVINCNMINGNHAENDGGGIYCETLSNPTISDNTISDNSANDGAGIYLTNNSSPNISGNTIQGNVAGTSGGGILCHSGTHPFISENIISGNFANNGHGGGVFLLSSPNLFELNEISGNFAAMWGGGVCIQSTSFIMNKITIVANEAATGGGLYSDNANPVLVNCIIWGNTPEQVVEVFGATVTMTYSDCQDGWSGTGNIDDNPSFVNFSQGDYHLQGNSPCIDTGDPDPMYDDPDGTRADMGCYYYHQGTAVDPREEYLLNEWALPSCFPNPFNPTTTISFDLPVAGPVKLDVFDISGCAVLVGARHASPLSGSGAIPTTGFYSAGTHQITFDGTGLPSGIYIYRLTAGDFTGTRKMVLMK
ncbi:hypothetical protein CEE37_00640 [candidate division LCP-89 bacterium B3_LCP]|uniref:Right handed beta helix domain-containing protein n=1 Tax=candidate division LCP-89 bacterium B3_LCP TaxID=2012998 RepID=A0A532V4T2_UNCL8|nr:MAG: hypothetical protein CEE37_00640 [candidate division LCP-89 bacterium B3_LCP]